MPHPQYQGRHSLRRLDGTRARPLTAQIIELYRSCYTAPPWNETPQQLAAYPAKLQAALERPAFTAHVACDPAGRLTGICYGWPSPPDLTASEAAGNPVYDAVLTALGPDGAAALTRGAFEVAELFVHPDAQRQGLGRHLLTVAVAGWPAAWLITHPNAPAARLYQRLGWRQHAALPRGLYPQLPLAIFTRTDPRPA
ncbi:GNAT family N-acetyltransferase [Spirillospora sp. NPDC000708]